MYATFFVNVSVTLVNVSNFCIFEAYFTPHHFHFNPLIALSIKNF